MTNNLRQKVLPLMNSQFIQSIFYSPFLSYHQWSLLFFVKAWASRIKPSESVLDVGAGELKYRSYFAHCKYVSNDACIGNKEWYFDEIEIKSSAYEIPVDDKSFDYILCTQVLEHLEFPERAFAEFYRILKSGGRLILTAPLGDGEHQAPYDFFRYTRFGLKSLGKRHDFDLAYIEPQGGVFINLEIILWQAIYTLLPFRRFLMIRIFYFVVLLPLKFSSGIVFNFLDLFDRKKVYTFNYNCVFLKK